MRNILFFASFFLTVFFFGCSKCQKKNLSQNDIDWVIHFKPGQTFCYRSLKGNYDTLAVIDIDRHYTLCNKLELSEYEYEIYTVRLKMKSGNGYNNDESFIYVTTEDWQQNNPYIFFGNLGPPRNDLENRIPSPIDTILSGIKFNSVYYYAKDLNAEMYGSKEYCKNFFWDKKLGLVAYTTVDDSVFLLVNQSNTQ